MSSRPDGVRWGGSIVHFVWGNMTRWVLYFALGILFFELARTWGTWSDPGVVAGSLKHVFGAYLVLSAVVVIVAVIHKTVDWVARDRR
ncbi:MAG: hypothetical protein AAFN07_17400 [Pseudomonadota bacterium]